MMCKNGSYPFGSYPYYPTISICILHPIFRRIPWDSPTSTGEWYVAVAPRTYNDTPHEPRRFASHVRKNIRNKASGSAWWELNNGANKTSCKWHATELWFEAFKMMLKSFLHDGVYQVLAVKETIDVLTRLGSTVITCGHFNSHEW